MFVVWTNFRSRVLLQVSVTCVLVSGDFDIAIAHQKLCNEQFILHHRYNQPFCMKTKFFFIGKAISCSQKFLAVPRHILFYVPYPLILVSFARLDYQFIPHTISYYTTQLHVPPPCHSSRRTWSTTTMMISR